MKLRSIGIRLKRFSKERVMKKIGSIIPQILYIDFGKDVRCTESFFPIILLSSISSILHYCVNANVTSNFVVIFESPIRPTTNFNLKLPEAQKFHSASNYDSMMIQAFEQLFSGRKTRTFIPDARCQGHLFVEPTYLS